MVTHVRPRGPIDLDECWSRAVEDVRQWREYRNRVARSMEIEEPVSITKKWLAIVRETAEHAKENAQKLREHPGMEIEARARELAATYLLETAQCLAMDEQRLAP